ncbi:MAG: DsrE family protein [Rhodospirillales bacterium]|nr:DsrE family protein [Rhodospirillales bacterium]
MMRAIMGLALALLLALPAQAGETKLAEPKPDWNKPRRIVLQMSQAERADAILTNAVNLQKFYGQDNVKIALVAYGNGVRALLKDESKVAARIQSLKQYEVEFVACGNTLETIGKKEADLLPGVTSTSTGLAEITERALSGWTVLVP